MGIAAFRTSVAFMRIVSFGPYRPSRLPGPAYWLRCVIAETVSVDGLPSGIPIVYLPGVSRDAFRALDSVADDLGALGCAAAPLPVVQPPERQGLDGSIAAVQQGARTRPERRRRPRDCGCAGRRPLTAVTATIRQGRLSKTHRRRLPQRPGQPGPRTRTTQLPRRPRSGAQRARIGGLGRVRPAVQAATSASIRPTGRSRAARRLGEAEGEWAVAWRRFRESPVDYPQLPERLRLARPDGTLHCPFTGLATGQ